MLPNSSERGVMIAVIAPPRAHGRFIGFKSCALRSPAPPRAASPAADGYDPADWIESML